MNRWWLNLAAERYWLEATDRDDIGVDLHAPETDESGKPNWRYTLFKEAQIGDVVLHYDKRSEENGIVGWSVVAGPPVSAPITWAARGSYAREKGIKPHERPGFIVPLNNLQKLSTPLTLERIRASEAGLRALVLNLQHRYGTPLYFPFELSNKRPIRLLQGYAFKLPRSFIDLFPNLAGVAPAAEVAGQRNPPWIRDELILALELYLRNPASPPSKTSHEVEELSDVLNTLGERLGWGVNAKFRNANGVYMKMMNFRRFDPEYTSAGQVRLTRGNKDEEVVWAEFAGDRAHLSKVADAIRQAITLPEVQAASNADDDETVEAEEGRLLTRLHRTRERNRALVDECKRRALKRFGKLVCEACTFDFEERYGPRGKGFIEAHHKKPVETLVEGSKTKLEDLALVCANCHRMIHSARPWLMVDELRKLLTAP